MNPHTVRVRANQPMRILITAGPTRELIDPIRFISNFSTGKMGYALAKTAKKRNHKVTLVSGPVSLSPPKGIKKIDVITAEDMSKAVKGAFNKADCLIMSAAVCDFKPRAVSKHKIKKNNKAHKSTLLLQQTPDVLSWAGKNKGKKIVVGFCLETKNTTKEAKRKLITKNADIIVANKIGRGNAAFGNGPTKVSILENSGAARNIGPENKTKIAGSILDKIETLWYKDNA